MTSPVTTLTRAARIRTMSTEDLATWIDRLLDMRLGERRPRLVRPGAGGPAG